MTELTGSVAVITGAARGQGRSHAVALAAEGADIIAIDRCADIESIPYPLATKADLDETVAAIEALGRRAVAVVADVRDLDSLTAGVQRGIDRLGDCGRPHDDHQLGHLVLGLLPDLQGDLPTGPRDGRGRGTR